ncbi:MAG TPA: hypothetical protein VIJ23_05065, partial [Mycobacterium sp.]
TAKMQFAAHLSRWLAECGSGPAELTGPVVDRFLIARRAGYSNYVGVGAVRPVLEYLQRVGAAPVSAVEPPASPGEALLARFEVGDVQADGFAGADGQPDLVGSIRTFPYFPVTVNVPACSSTGRRES